MSSSRTASRQGCSAAQLKSNAQQIRELLSQLTFHLASVKQQLEHLEQQPADSEALEALHHSFHTIQSEAAYYQLSDMQAVAQESDFIIEAALKREEALTSAQLELMAGSAALLVDLEKLVQDALSNATDLRPSDAVEGHLTQLRESLMKLLLASQRESKLQVERPQTEEQAAEPSPTTVPTLVDRLSEAVDDLAQRQDDIVDGLKWLETLSPENKAGVIGIHQKIRELRGLVGELAEQPVEQMAETLNAVMTQAAERLRRYVELHIEGGELMLPRYAVDPVRDALVHLVRNAVVHGIESPAFRIEGGKQSVGHIRVTVTRQLNEVRVEVRDDGRGLQVHEIETTARRLGLMDRSRSENAVDLIFVPGLSTAKEVTPLSGRGLGLEEAQRSIGKLGGSLTASFTPNEGTHFTMRFRLS